VRERAVILAGYTGMLAVREGDWVSILGRGSGRTTTDYTSHAGMHLEELGLQTSGWKMKGVEPDPSLPRGQLYKLANNRGGPQPDVRGPSDLSGSYSPTTLEPPRPGTTTP
jgi:hypothetical protein